MAIGAPHVATEVNILTRLHLLDADISLQQDFTYQGYTIPKGAMVLGNLWLVLPTALPIG